MPRDPSQAVTGDDSAETRQDYRWPENLLRVVISVQPNGHSETHGMGGMQMCCRHAGSRLLPGPGFAPVIGRHGQLKGERRRRGLDEA